MYVKEMVLNGRQVIAILFVANGEVASAFVPTHPEVDGPAGHFWKWIEYYIKSQEMVKRHEEGQGIIEDVDEDESAETPARPEP